MQRGSRCCVATSPRCRRVPAAKPRVPLTQVLSALTFHVMKTTGTLGEHFTELFQTHLADSSLADRRARLPWAIFAALMQRMLRPRATPDGEPAAFWRGWRLVAIDGTQFSLPNAPAIKRRAPQSPHPSRPGPRSRSCRRWCCSRWGGTIPWPPPWADLASRKAPWRGRCGPRSPARSLVLADRLYGTGAMAAALADACTRVDSHCLVRVPTAIKAERLARLAGGSHVVRVALRPRSRPTPEMRTLTVREVHVQVARPGQRATVVRLWTTLLDPAAAAALDLARLYAERWEQELYFRDVKHQLRRTDLLQSHTVDTAAQEVAALILASALLAEGTRAGGRRPRPPSCASASPNCCRSSRACGSRWTSRPPVLTDEQTQFILSQMYDRMRQRLTPERRARSCPRAVRQPRGQVAAPAEKTPPSTAPSNTPSFERLTNFRKALSLDPRGPWLATDVARVFRPANPRLATRDW